MTGTSEKNFLPSFPNLYTVGIPFAVLLSFVLLSMKKDIGLHVPLLVCISAFIVILLSIAVYMTEDAHPRWHWGTVLVVGLLIRVLFAVQPPGLSDDIYRYVLDGQQILNGHNPYSLPPDKIHADSVLTAGLLKHVNHPDLITIYPPAAQLVFAAGTAPGGVTSLKILLCLMDMATCWMILRILSITGRNTDRAVIYAWHPLPVLEIASSGHIDAAAVFFLLAAIFTYMVWKPDNVTGSIVRNVSSAIFFALSCLTKLYPLVYAPLLLKKAARESRAMLLISVCMVSALLCGIFLPDILNGIGTLSHYLQKWEFSGFVFRLLRNMKAPQQEVRMMLAGFFALWTVIVSLNIHGWYGADSDRDMVARIYLITMGYLILTPTLHPWYALYLTVLLPFLPGTAGICLSWSVLLSYYVLIVYRENGVWEEWDVMTLMVFSAPVFAGVIRALTLRNDSLRQ